MGSFCAHAKNHRQKGLTIHSSRRRFGGAVYSGVPSDAAARHRKERGRRTDVRHFSSSGAVELPDAPDDHCANKFAQVAQVIRRPRWIADEKEHYNWLYFPCSSNFALISYILIGKFAHRSASYAIELAQEIHSLSNEPMLNNDQFIQTEIKKISQIDY
ncbi:MAG: hypothetical protein U0586_01900 [Candidatus Brocadiaceae bacterium]